VFAVQFTLATYVQLIDLSVPFLTAIIAWTLLREPMPSRTLSALAAIVVGSFLVITVNPFHIQLPNGRSDLIGVGIALVSSLMMALGVVYTRRLTTGKQSPTQVFFQMVLVMTFAYGVLSLSAGESWQPFTSLSIRIWITYALFIILAVIGAGLTQILAISRINATLFSTLLSWRLLVAVAAGWIVLGERLTTIWQVIGIVIVILSITLYVQYQAVQG
jgi:drug/metabolite transporter (DMT)-like permease